MYQQPSVLRAFQKFQPFQLFQPLSRFQGFNMAPVAHAVSVLAMVLTMSIALMPTARALHYLIFRFGGKIWRGGCEHQHRSET